MNTSHNLQASYNRVAAEYTRRIADELQHTPLDRAHLVGSLDVGKIADIALFDLPSEQHVGYRFGTVQPYAVFKCGEQVV